MCHKFLPWIQRRRVFLRVYPADTTDTRCCGEYLIDFLSVGMRGTRQRPLSRDSPDMYLYLSVSEPPNPIHATEMADLLDTAIH